MKWNVHFIVTVKDRASLLILTFNRASHFLPVTAKILVIKPKDSIGEYGIRKHSRSQWTNAYFHTNVHILCCKLNILDLVCTAGFVWNTYILAALLN